MRLAKPASAAAARKPSVQAAANGVACRGSSVNGRSPACARGGGARVHPRRGASRARSRARRRPRSRARRVRHRSGGWRGSRRAVASSKAWTCGLRAKTRRSRPRARGPPPVELGEVPVGASAEAGARRPRRRAPPGRAPRPRRRWSPSAGAEEQPGGHAGPQRPTRGRRGRRSAGRGSSGRKRASSSGTSRARAFAAARSSAASQPGASRRRSARRWSRRSGRRRAASASASATRPAPPRPIAGRATPRPAPTRTITGSVLLRFFGRAPGTVAAACAHGLGGHPEERHRDATGSTRVPSATSTGKGRCSGVP